MFTPEQTEVIKALKLVAKREGNLLGILQGVFITLTIIGLTMIVYARVDLESDLALVQTMEATDVVTSLRNEMDSWGFKLEQPVQPE